MARQLSALLILLLAFLALDSSAAVRVVNNGSAPPDPENVWSGGVLRANLQIRNVNCGRVDDPCAHPLTPTRFELSGGAVWQDSTGLLLDVRDSSVFRLAGGTLGGGPAGLRISAVGDHASLLVSGGRILWVVVASGDSTYEQTGGRVRSVDLSMNARGLFAGGALDTNLRLFDSALVLIEGGVVPSLEVNEETRAYVSGGQVDEIEAGVSAREGGYVEVAGSDFAIDGVPVPYGFVELPGPAFSGRLTGRLASGEPIDADLRLAHNVGVGRQTAVVELTPELRGPPDADADGVPDGYDNCETVENPDQIDKDLDGVGDLCNEHLDRDRDGYADDRDNCPDDPNPLQEDTSGDFVGDLCNDALDFDADEWEDANDNCPESFNPGQENGDGDTFGDLCDLFADDPFNAGLLDLLLEAESELNRCLEDPPFLDADADGEHDRSDACPGTPAGEPVDAAGCSRAQFCAGFSVQQSGRPMSRGGSACARADWRGDAAPDCRVTPSGCAPR